MMCVNRKYTDDWTVVSPFGARVGLSNRLAPVIGGAIPGLFYKELGYVERSFNWIPSHWPKWLNARDADIVHLQWVNSEMLSIKDIVKINKPLVMTMQDMWAFCGSEHYTEETRWQSEYTAAPDANGITGYDVDRWTWRRKKKHWHQPLQLVAISQWLADCASSSSLFKDWPITVIPNPIDTNVWQPLDRMMARKAFGLPLDKKIITFGALGGTSNPRKGYEHLKKALSLLPKERDNIHVVVFGQSEPKKADLIPFSSTYVGRMSDPVAMCLLNNAADVFVNPAVQEAFGQTASEAQACGLPVVAFKDTGIADIVEHQKTGYLGTLGNSEELAEGISWTLQHGSTDNHGDSQMRVESRKRAMRLFSYEAVGKRYLELYNEVLKSA